jgi:transposase-like protein
MINNIPETLLEAVRYYSDSEVCRKALADVRWPDGKVSCPRADCGGTEVWTINSKTRGIIWRCKTCRKQFTVKVGTIFEDSPLGLDKWLPAFWLEMSSKKDVSSHQLGRALHVTQRTAWFMLHRIRLTMRENGDCGPLSGEVEVDETFVGGKERNKHASRRRHLGTGGIGKCAVMGLLKRHGTVRAKTVKTTRKGLLQEEIRRNVAPGSIVYTDSLKSYEGLEEQNYIHEVINHAEAYVRGNVHTNGLENFWSLFKRTIYGTHHSVEAFHLDRYLDSATFRFNTRKMKDGERFQTALKRADGRRLTWNELTGKEGDDV